MTAKLTPEQVLLICIFGRPDIYPEVDDKGKQLIRKVLETLNEREQMVINLHFGLGSQERMTQSEVGKRLPRYDNRYSEHTGGYEVCKQRVGQIEAKALRKLRHPRRSGLLKYMMEADS